MTFLKDKIPFNLKDLSFFEFPKVWGNNSFYEAEGFSKMWTDVNGMKQRCTLSEDPSANTSQQPTTRWDLVSKIWAYGTQTMSPYLQEASFFSKLHLGTLASCKLREHASFLTLQQLLDSKRLGRVSKIAMKGSRNDNLNADCYLPPVESSIF